MRQHGLAPLAVDVGEVVLVDLDARDVGAAGPEVRLDERAQFGLVRLEVEEKRLRGDGLLGEGVELGELLRLVVAGGHVPVEVVLGEDVEDGVVGQEGDLLRVERAEEERRTLRVERAGAADGEDQLHEALVDVLAHTRLGLGPERVLRLVEGELGGGDGHAEVDLADDARGVKGREPVRRDLVLQLLLKQSYGVFRHRLLFKPLYTLYQNIHSPNATRHVTHQSPGSSLFSSSRD